MNIDTDNLYDPNSHIDQRTRDRAKIHSSFAFDSARVEAHEVDSGAPNSFIVGRAGDHLHLVYVRVTFEEEQEEGAGPVPGILIDMAREMGAEPHVVRVHYRKQGSGTGIEYFGYDELERALKSGDYWRRALIGKRTARDYLTRVKGRLSKIQVEVISYPPGERHYMPPPKESLSSQELILRQIFGEEDIEHDYFYPGWVFLKLRVDTFTPELEDRPIGIRALTESAIYSDKHDIFTCDDGVWECWPGQWPGVEVVHEDGLVVWRDRGIRPMRVTVFDRKEYRHEILSKVRRALEFHEGMGPGASLGAGDYRDGVEAALHLAEGSEEE